MEKAASALDGVSKVDVDLAGKKATIDYNAEKVTVNDLKKAITDQGYDVID